MKLRKFQVEGVLGHLQGGNYKFKIISSTYLYPHQINLQLSLSWVGIKENEILIATIHFPPPPNPLFPSHYLILIAKCCSLLNALNANSPESECTLRSNHFCLLYPQLKDGRNSASISYKLIYYTNSL